LLNAIEKRQKKIADGLAHTLFCERELMLKATSIDKI